MRKPADIIIPNNSEEGRKHYEEAVHRHDAHDDVHAHVHVHALQCF